MYLLQTGKFSATQSFQEPSRPFSLALPGDWIYAAGDANSAHPTQPVEGTMYYTLLFAVEALILLLGALAVWTSLSPRSNSKLKPQEKLPSFAVPRNSGAWSASSPTTQAEPESADNAIAVLSITGANKSVSNIVCRVQHRRERQLVESRK